MESIEMIMVMAIVIFLMYPTTHDMFCDTLEKITFGYVRCDNVVGVLACLLMMVGVMVYTQRLSLPRMAAMSPF